MPRLQIRENIYRITHRRQFQPLQLNDDFKGEVFDFAYGMTFGNAGQHRNHRTGGQHRRKNGELFADTFQGKMAEFFLYEYFTNNGFELQEPDIEQWDLGRWDETDLIINDFMINVKSTKSFGNLLLLETKDWNENGQYIPNIENGEEGYDFFILTRINPFASDILKQNRLLYSNECNRERLRGMICDNHWSFDIAGWITQADLVRIIGERYILPQNSLLMSKYTKMDAENYYYQAGAMNIIDQLIPILQEN